ncbi:MFS transporter [Actinomadura rugatobispora]|uniref:MFS transporter n=1 Tax=Actinomadura rugatobispora TaxID=1994 RepID=A0ABW1A0D1_9ACTN|nr:MFS transporter [Actinomadura rugatobispora]
MSATVAPQPGHGPGSGPASGKAARAGAREWAGLAVLALPTLLLSLDNTVLFLALPHLGEDLRPGPTQLLWIMDVYGFMMAGFLVTMGTLGDRIGRRRLLVTGAAAFGAASALAAYAPTAEALIAARVLLGVTGATLMPSALALISTMFRDERQRTLAIGVFTGCFMGGAALGPIVGGALLESFWWGSVFLIGVPVMLLLLITAPLLLPESRDPGAGRVDPPGVALSLLAILPFIYGLKEIAKDPAQPLAYAALAAGALFGTLFVRRQRTVPHPLLDLRLFRRRSFSAALVIVLFGMVVQGGVYLFASQYLQSVEGLSPLRSGLWLALPTLALVAGSLLSPLAARRIRPGTLIAAGLVTAAAGFLLMAAADGPAALISGMTVGFLGTAPVGALGIGLIVGSAPQEKAGAASAVAETSGEFGIALGVAVLGSAGTAAYRALLDVPAEAPPEAETAARESVGGAVTAAEGLPSPLAGQLLDNAKEAFMSGLGVTALISTVLVLALAALAAALLRHQPPIGR